MQKAKEVHNSYKAIVTKEEQENAFFFFLLTLKKDLVHFFLLSEETWLKVPAATNMD